VLAIQSEIAAQPGPEQVVQEITLPVTIGALEIKASYGLSYWDAAIVAAARALGCRELLSEDMSHGREVEGIRISNPFR
jgi:predicted nucleic acid-binding protein